MDIEKYWNKALKNTEIVRARVQALMTYAATSVPYVFLAESSINLGDTIVRKGEIVVEKPAIIIPPNNPQLSGFEFDKKEIIDENSLINFLIVRGVSLPSFKYDNKTHSLDLYEGKLSKAIKHYEDLLQSQENVKTGLIVGPEDCWQFSLLLFICTQILKNADTDIRKILKDFRKNNNQ